MHNCHDGFMRFFLSLGNMDRIIISLSNLAIGISRQKVKKFVNNQDFL